MSPRAPPDRHQGALLPAFYAGRSVLITGATGFLGKVLVARLLATCPDVSALHLLLRRKRDVLPADRLVLLKQCQVFESVRLRSPAQLDKLHALPGDTALPDLGLAPGDLAQLQQVSVVIHAAATLKFDEGLSTAVQQNVRSALRLCDLCDTLPRLEVVVHVSTAYAHTEHGTLEERVYPPPADLHHLLALTDALPPPLLAAITPQYIHPKPNTYTFTKAMAESALAQRKDRRYALAIFRPSIVISAMRDPLPGWVENLNGPAGVVAGAGAGALHVVSCRQAARADLLPVDIAADTLLAVPWDTLAHHHSGEVRVYNCSSVENPTTWRQFKECMVRAVRDHPFDNAIWYPFGITTQNRVFHWIAETALQTVPLAAADFVARLLHLPTKVSLSVASGRLRAMNAVLRFFALREWTFCNKNVVRMRDRLSTADRQIYNLDPRTIRWEEQYGEFVRGARRYLLRQRDEDLPRARARMQRLWALHASLCYGAAAVLARALLPRLLRLLAPALLRLRDKLRDRRLTL